MTSKQIRAERVNFEATYRRKLKLGKDSTLKYNCKFTDIAWDAWTARSELAHAERREMQETEQRLRAEIARLQAIADRAVPDGWRLVPVEPTPEMWAAGLSAEPQDKRHWVDAPGYPPKSGLIVRDPDCVIYYRAMLSAAPQPEVASQVIPVPGTVITGRPDVVYVTVPSPHAAVPDGWKLVPIEPTPEIIAAAAMATWPVASADDIALARQAAPLVLMDFDLGHGFTADSLAATLATMAPAYRAIIAAAPQPAAPTREHLLDLVEDQAATIVTLQDELEATTQPAAPVQIHAVTPQIESVGEWRIVSPTDTVTAEIDLQSPDPNVEAVRTALLDRSRVGLLKYGVTTADNPLSTLEWLTHLQHELMDAAVYVEAAKRELAQQGTHTDAARDVLAERRRQIEAEGWTPEHDDEHADGSMALAAACYAAGGDSNPMGCPPSYWPWDSEWWKPSQDDRRNLVKAGALILAEIERLDRAVKMEAPRHV